MIHATKATTKNVVNVDLEEWFVVEILADRIPKEEWDN